MLEVVTVKPKMQQRLQEVGDVRNVAHLLRKAASSEQSQPKGKAMWVGCNLQSNIGVVLPA